MLYRLRKWYVENMLMKTNLTTHAVVAVFSFMYLFCLSEILPKQAIFAHQIIWYSCFAVLILIAADMILWDYLDKNLMIHYLHLDNDHLKFIGFFDKSKGEFIEFYETDFILSPKFNCETFCFSTPLIFENEAIENNLFRKKIKTILVETGGLSNVDIILDLFVVLKDEFNPIEVAGIISDFYCEHCKYIGCYEEYLFAELGMFAKKWTKNQMRDNSADDQAWLKNGNSYLDSGNSDKTPQNNYQSSLELADDFFKAVAADFHPKLLSNVEAVEVAPTDNEEDLSGLNLNLDLNQN